MEDIPSDFDAIVVGTGLVESIYAAAAARIGKTVLHIDSNTHYSGEWAVLGLTGLLDWVAQHSAGGQTAPSEADRQPGTRPLRRRELVHGVVQHWYIEEGEQVVEECPLRRGVNSTGATSASDFKSVSEVTSHDPAHVGDRSEPAGGDPSAAATQRDQESAVPPEESSVPPAESHLPPSESFVPSSEATVPTTETSISQPEAHLSSSESAVPPSESAVPPSESAVSPSESAVPPSESAVPSTESCGLPSEPHVPSTESSTPLTDPVSASASSAAPERRCTESPDWTINRMKKLTRRFNIDLAPKVLYSRGALVELLISSNIARYAEFRSVGQLLTPLHGQLQPVPSSRADVFTTRHVSVVEKRLLMKLLSFCVEFEKHPDEFKGYEQRPFSEFLRSRRLTDNLTHHVTHAIAMVTPQTPTIEALRATQKFLRSLGRYGNTPFLWPMYGSGELPQCFCRMCAVFGGVYHLSRGVEALTVDEAGGLTGVVSNGQRLTCRHLLLEEAYRPTAEQPTSGGGVSRAILITDRSLYGPVGDQVLLIRLPAEEDQPGPVTVLQVGPAASAAPAGLFILHLTCEARASAEEDLSPAVAQLQQLSAAETGDGGPAAPLRLLAALYFSRRSADGGRDASLPDAAAICSGPDADIGFDAAVREARDLFSAHFPGEEFLPRAPDPEEIIFFDGPADSVVTGGARPEEGDTGHGGQAAETAAGDAASCQPTEGAEESGPAGTTDAVPAAAQVGETAAGDAASCQPTEGAEVSGPAGTTDAEPAAAQVGETAAGDAASCQPTEGAEESGPAGTTDAVPAAAQVVETAAEHTAGAGGAARGETATAAGDGPAV